MFSQTTNYLKFLNLTNLIVLTKKQQQINKQSFYDCCENSELVVQSTSKNPKIIYQIKYFKIKFEHKQDLATKKAARRLAYFII